MKEIDPIGNPVFNDHSLGIAFNQFGRGTMQLVREQDRGFFVAKIFNDHLAQGSLIARKLNRLVEDSGGFINAGNPLELNSPPGGEGLLVNGVDHLRGTSANGDEVDLHLIELLKMGVGGQFGIENEFFGEMTGSLLPEGHKTEKLIVLFVFAKLPVY